MLIFEGDFYHGSDMMLPFLKKGSWVSTSVDEAWKYAFLKCRDNGLSGLDMRLFCVEVNSHFEDLFEIAEGCWNGIISKDCSVRMLSPEEASRMVSPLTQRIFCERTMVYDLMPVLKKKLDGFGESCHNGSTDKNDTYQGLSDAYFCQ